MLSLISGHVTSRRLARVRRRIISCWPTSIQSEVFFEAVRGSGGIARLVLLPFEDHGYRARESVEHVLWEQLRWFERYVKGAAGDGGAPVDG